MASVFVSKICSKSSTRTCQMKPSDGGRQSYTYSSSVSQPWLQITAQCCIHGWCLISLLLGEPHHTPPYTTIHRHTPPYTTIHRVSNLSYYRRFFRFEPLTLIPIQKKLLDVTLLSLKEINWLNDYHKMVSSYFLKQLFPSLPGW